jgi:hypothetical protein
MQIATEMLLFLGIAYLFKKEYSAMAGIKSE